MKWIKIALNDEEKKELENAEKQVEKIQLLKRLQCLKLKDKGWKHKDLAAFFNVSMDTISNWLISYRNDGVKGMLNWDNNGRVSTISLEQQKILRETNEKKSFETAKEAKEFIAKEFGYNFHLHYVQKLLKKNFSFHIKKQD